MDVDSNKNFPHGGRGIGPNPPPPLLAVESFRPRNHVPLAPTPLLYLTGVYMYTGINFTNKYIYLH